MKKLNSILFLGLISLLPITAQAADATLKFNSPATGTEITGTIMMPAKPLTNAAGAMSTVLYLKNLSIPRLGTDSDDVIIQDLQKEGDLVVVLDYAHDPKAVSPTLNADMLELRHEIYDKPRRLLTDYKVDMAHIFILIEGYRLMRNVEFARDGKRVLGMDIQYPSHPAKPVPVLMEFTCDNVDRMGTFSLLFCHDTLTDGGQAAGFAVAMCDHPVAPPYKSFDDPMPDLIYRAKAAVRTLRSLMPEINGNGSIGCMGFSRGGPITAMLAFTNNQPAMEGDGEHKGISSAIQAGLIHGNIYDYSIVKEGDHSYGPFTKKWGPKDQNLDKWLMHAGMYYAKKDFPPPPMFLNTTKSEQREFQEGLASVDKKLTEMGVDPVYQVDDDARGHQVSHDPKTLGEIYAFFHKHLDQPTSN